MKTTDNVQFRVSSATFTDLKLGTCNGHMMHMQW